MSKDAEALPAWLGWARLGIGLAQGIALYFMTEWTSGPLTALQAACWAALWLIPVLVIGGLGSIRPATLTIWTLVAVLMAGGLAYYDVARLGDERIGRYGPQIVFGLVPVLIFIGHHLVAAGDEARRWIAPYERYFDLGWRHGAQLLLAILFTGAFWAVLMLGVAMFNMIELDFLSDLVSKPWFGYPATCVVFAAAIHLTDLRSGLVRGARALGLVLLSWLLPAMTGLTAAFLIALPFTGLQPLWATRAATAILLGAAATLVILINAAYQDGVGTPNPVLRWSARIASVLMTPIAVLAAYALYLRIDQYGLTPDRIYAAALLLIGVCYAVSYAIGALAKQWMKPLEIGNLISAVVVIAVAIALFSPIADPARLSVNDQMARLASGRITPEQVDVAFLRFDGARYGRDALHELRDDQSTPERRALSVRAANALAMEYRHQAYERDAVATRPLVVTMHPAGAELPAGFTTSGVGRMHYMCTDQQNPCDGYLIDLDGDGVDELLLSQVSPVLIAFAHTGSGEWARVGEFRVSSEDHDRLARGEARVAPALVGDLVIGNTRARLQADYGDEDWPAAAAAPDDAPASNR